MSKKTAPDSAIANINPFGLRMQPDLKDRLQTAASASNRSLNAEIIHRLEESIANLNKQESIGKLVELAEKMDALARHAAQREAEMTSARMAMHEARDEYEKLKQALKLVSSSSDT